MFFIRLLNHNKSKFLIIGKYVQIDVISFYFSIKLREFKRTAVYKVSAHAAFCADEEIVQEMSQELVEQHTQVPLKLAGALKKSNSLLFNIVLFFDNLRNIWFRFWVHRNQNDFDFKKVDQRSEIQAKHQQRGEIQNTKA